MSWLARITRSASLKPVHAAWFVSIFVFGLALIFLIPPFQTNDETHHFMRLLSMPTWRGCQQVPVEAEAMQEALTYKQVRLENWKYQLRRLDAALALHESGRRKWPHKDYVAACQYPATAYYLPALTGIIAARLWSIDRGKLVARFYGARIGNWLTLSLCVLLAMWYVPSLRTWLLCAFSVPMVLQQSVSINQDALIFGLCALLTIPVFARNAPWKRIAAIVLIAYLLTQMKPVFAPLALLALVPLGEHLNGRDRAFWRRLFLGTAFFSSLALLLFAIFGEHWAVRAADRLDAPEWAKPAQQMAALFADPSLGWRALKAQLHDNLGRGHLTGGWISVLGVMGWCQFELPADVYDTILLALRMSLLASLLAAPLATRLGRPSAFVGRWLPLSAPLLVILLVDFSFWLVFTPPGSAYVIGVQGRYYIGPLIVLGALIAVWLGNVAARFHREATPIRFTRGALTVAAWLLMLAADLRMWEFISQHYYHEGRWG